VRGEGSEGGVERKRREVWRRDMERWRKRGKGRTRVKIMIKERGCRERKDKKEGSSGYSEVTCDDIMKGERVRRIE
jgi:hypothetical protein